MGGLEFFAVFYGFLRLALDIKKPRQVKGGKPCRGIEAEPYENSSKEKQKGGRTIPCSFSIETYTY